MNKEEFIEKIEELKLVIIFQDKLIDELRDYIKLHNILHKKPLTRLEDQRINLEDYIK